MAEVEKWTVVNVYEHAQLIGKECEKIIDLYGVEALAHLMPKVVKTLEYLEHLVTARESDNAEMISIKDRVQELLLERCVKDKTESNYEEELRKMEMQFKSENADLMEAVCKLRNENAKLLAALDYCQSKEDQIKETAEREFLLITRLKETVDKQRLELRLARDELHDKQMDIEAMASRIERLSKTALELRNKQQLSQKQATRLLADKSELEAAIHEREKQLTEMMAHVSQIQPVVNGENTSSTYDDKNEPEITEKITADSLDGKLIIDPRDPNRPRFTMQELKQVLMERNDLKAKLMEIEDALDSRESSCKDDSPESSGSCEKLPASAKRQKPSGVRKFFRSIFSSGDQRQTPAT